MSDTIKQECAHCSNRIEFEAHEMEAGECRDINCPHCGLETKISRPIPQSEIDHYKLVYFVNSIMEGMHERARNHFFGTIAVQSMFDCYKWVYAIHKLSETTHVPFGFSETDQQELDSIGSMAVDALSSSQIKQAHIDATKEVISVLTGQSGSVESQNNYRKPISSDVRRDVWRRDEGKCTKCGSRERLEFDHIVPVSKGGSNTARNIELLCESCNRTKSDNI